MNIELKGVVTQISLKEVINEKLEKKKIVLEHTEAAGERYYTNHYPIEFINKNMALLDSVIVGDEITALCNLKGKITSTEKVFLTIDCWKIK